MPPPSADERTSGSIARWWRWAEMGYSISYDTGFFGALAIVFCISVGLIVAIWLIKAAKDARDEVTEDKSSDDDLKW